MKKREVLFAVMGSVVGAVLVMAVGSFSLLGAHDEIVDLKVGEITCTGLTVSKGDWVRVVLIADEGGGFVHVLGNGGRVAIIGDESGGNVNVYLKDLRSIPEARMSADENGGFVHVTGFLNGKSASVTLNPSGLVKR